MLRSGVPVRGVTEFTSFPLAWPRRSCRLVDSLAEDQNGVGEQARLSCLRITRDRRFARLAYAAIWPYEVSLTVGPWSGLVQNWCTVRHKTAWCTVVREQIVQLTDGLSLTTETSHHSSTGSGAVLDMLVGVDAIWWRTPTLGRMTRTVSCV